MDWSIPVYVICIELDGHNEEKDEKCREILRENGFVFEHRMCINEFWCNPLYYRIDLLYNKDEQFTHDQQHLYMEPHCISEINEGIDSYAKKQR